MTDVTINGNMKIITPSENKILVYGEARSSIIYAPLTFDENCISEVDYVIEIIEESEVENLNNRIDGIEDVAIEIAMTSLMT
jgi:hypothetical protein